MCFRRRVAAWTTRLELLNALLLIHVKQIAVRLHLGPQRIGELDGNHQWLDGLKSIQMVRQIQLGLGLQVEVSYVISDNSAQIIII